MSNDRTWKVWRWIEHLHCCPGRLSLPGLNLQCELHGRAYEGSTHPPPPTPFIHSLWPHTHALLCLSLLTFFLIQNPYQCQEQLPSHSSSPWFQPSSSLLWRYFWWCGFSAWSAMELLKTIKAIILLSLRRETWVVLLRHLLMLSSKDIHLQLHLKLRWEPHQPGLLPPLGHSNPELKLCLVCKAYLNWFAIIVSEIESIVQCRVEIWLLLKSLKPDHSCHHSTTLCCKNLIQHELCVPRV